MFSIIVYFYQLFSFDLVEMETVESPIGNAKSSLVNGVVGYYPVQLNNNNDKIRHPRHNRRETASVISFV